METYRLVHEPFDWVAMGFAEPEAIRWYVYNQNDLLCFGGSKAECEAWILEIKKAK
jgi:hypothetical protein